MKFFDENYSQEIPTCIKCLRKKYNLKQSDPKNEVTQKSLTFLGYFIPIRIIETPIFNNCPS